MTGREPRVRGGRVEAPQAEPKSFRPADPDLEAFMVKSLAEIDRHAAQQLQAAQEGFAEAIVVLPPDPVEIRYTVTVRIAGQQVDHHAVPDPFGATHVIVTWRHPPPRAALPAPRARR